MTASLHLKPPKPALNRGSGVKQPTIGIREDRIDGGFVKITPMQLVMAWWLHLEGHITRRQLRVWFAAIEMAERRRHGNHDKDAPRPLYRVEEIQTLIGGRGNENASAAIRADVRRLAKLGLVIIEKHSIDFAVSIDQIRIDDISGFWSMWENIPNQRRTVPVPRRTLRALAGGFSRAVTATMIALLLRGLFWHKQEGDYRTDHRTKLSWIADVFGVSRRAVTDARARLIELGWLEPVECSQWELNRWGVRDRIRTDWSLTDRTPEKIQDTTSESASPNPENGTESASPLNRYPSPTEKSLNTRRLEGTAPNPAGVSKETKGLGNRKKRVRAATANPPSLWDIQPQHLGRTDDLLMIYGDAVEAGLVSGSEAGRLDFLSLAERARAHGTNPGGLLRWLLKHKRFDFITQADEDAATFRIREYNNGPVVRRGGGGGEVTLPRRQALALTDDERFVQAFLVTTKQHRIDDPFYIAQKTKGWTRDEWDQKREDFELRQMQRWMPVGEGG